MFTLFSRSPPIIRSTFPAASAPNSSFGWPKVVSAGLITPENAARLFPKASRKWLFGYRERDLRFALHTLRSEQNRETAIIGIQDLLQSGGYRR